VQTIQVFIVIDLACLKNGPTGRRTLRCVGLSKSWRISTHAPATRVNGTSSFVHIDETTAYRLVAYIAHGCKLISFRLPALNDSPPLSVTLLNYIQISCRWAA
jgi:hypothetical protein